MCHHPLEAMPVDAGIDISPENVHAWVKKTVIYGIMLKHAGEEARCWTHEYFLYLVYIRTMRFVFGVNRDPGT